MPQITVGLTSTTVLSSAENPRGRRVLVKNMDAKGAVCFEVDAPATMEGGYPVDEGGGELEILLPAGAALNAITVDLPSDVRFLVV
jgi:hypothetical protein